MSEEPETTLTSRKIIPLFAGGRFRIGTIAGFPIYLHWTLLLIPLVFLLVMGSDPTGFLFYCAIVIPSVFIHEMAHALSSKLLGFGTGSITIWILGGYFIPYHLTCLPYELEKERRLLYTLILLSGPSSNLVLGILSYAGYFFTQSSLLIDISNLNLSLGLLNLLPLPPLDGSQVIVTFASLALKRRYIHFALLFIQLAIFVTCFSLADSNNPIVDVFLRYTSIMTMGILWTARFAFKSDRALREEWNKGINSERSMAEGE